MCTKKLTVKFLILGALMLCPAVIPAQAIWTHGTITKAPWKGEYIHIGVNDVSYTFLNKDIRIAKGYEVKPGMYNERQLAPGDLTVGQSVMIRAQGHRIYEIHVVE